MSVNDYNFVPGVYRVQGFRLNVRGTKDWNQSGNLVGYSFTIGKTFPVYDVEVDDKGFPWGIVTLPQASQTHYVCLWNGNRVLAKLVTPLPAPVSNQVNPQWAIQLDRWARSQGYDGIPPLV